MWVEVRVGDTGPGHRSSLLVTVPWCAASVGPFYRRVAAQIPVSGEFPGWGRRAGACHVQCSVTWVSRELESESWAAWRTQSHKIWGHSEWFLQLNISIIHSGSVVRNVLKLCVYVTSSWLVIKNVNRDCALKWIKKSNAPIKSVILGKSDMKCEK